MNLDPSAWPPIVWLIAAIAMLAGYGLGVLLSRRDRGTERIRELERQLDEARDEFDAYRGQVSGHFTDTSKHLRDLALQYRTVYEHLAEGARTLCPDSAVRLEARGLARDLLPASARDDSSALGPDDSSAPPPENGDAPTPEAQPDPDQDVPTSTAAPAEAEPNFQPRA